MFSSSIRNMLKSGFNEQIEGEDEIVSYLKGGKKKQTETNPNTDFRQEDDEKMTMDEEKNEEKKINTDNIKKKKIPNARYSQYKQQLDRIEKFINKYGRKNTDTDF